jgi:hypothetical protein
MAEHGPGGPTPPACLMGALSAAAVSAALSLSL